MQSSKRIVPSPIPAPVTHALFKLGRDMALARRRRRISQVSMAERAGTSVSTIRRMEHGDGNVSLVFYARTLHILGALRPFEDVLDTVNDPIGAALMDEQVPKRVRQSKGPVAW